MALLFLTMSKLKHAKHNKEACEYLIESGKFNDWVITTAFYSALHFIESNLFPLSITYGSKTVRYNSFDHYCDNTTNYNSKHRLRRTLIEEHLSEIAVEYNSLMDLCWTARYSNYNHSSDIASLAKTNLDSIINVLS